MEKKVTKKDPYLEYDGDMIILDDESVSIDYLTKLYQEEPKKKKEKKTKKERTN